MVPIRRMADYRPQVMEVPANAASAAHELHVRVVYSELVRALARVRAQDPKVSDAHAYEAVQRFAARYGSAAGL